MVSGLNWVEWIRLFVPEILRDEEREGGAIERDSCQLCYLCIAAQDVLCEEQFGSLNNAQWVKRSCNTSFSLWGWEEQD